MVAVCRMPQVEEASAAKLEELRLGAVSQGKDWLRRSLSEMSARPLRVLAAAGGVQTHSNRNWLPVAELRNSLMKVLEPSTEVGFNQKMCCDMSCFCDRIRMFVRHGIMFVQYQGSTNKYLQHLLHLFRSL